MPRISTHPHLRSAGRISVRAGRFAVPLALLMVATSFAAGDGLPIVGGSRNPGTNARFSYRGQTEIIADNSTFGTRQSNKGTGGGAIYGCRSAPAGPACL